MVSGIAAQLSAAKALRARAEVVQAARDALLAAAGLPPDQDVDRSTGQFEDLPAQVFHGPRNADQLTFDAALVGHLLA